MPKSNLELFKIFVLNLPYIYSKRRKLGITSNGHYKCSPYDLLAFSLSEIIF